MATTEQHHNPGRASGWRWLWLFVPGVLLTTAVVGVCIYAYILGSKRLRRADLFGTYVADYDLATEKVTLAKNGTYTQRVILKDTWKTEVAKGKWKYRPSTASGPTDGYITFDNHFMVVFRDFRHLKPQHNEPHEGIVGLPVDNALFGRIGFGSAERCIYWKKGDP